MLKPTPTTPAQPGLQSRPPSRHEQPAMPAPNHPDLAALSAAGDRYVPAAESQHPDRRRPSVIPALWAALLVGGSLALWHQPQYRCIGTLQIQGQPSAAQVAGIRKELLDFTWGLASIDPEGTALQRGWFVKMPDGTTMQLGMISAERESGLRHVQETARDFCRRMKALAEAVRGTPTRAEGLFAAPLDRMGKEFAEAERQASAASQAVPIQDPDDRREELLVRWRSLRGNFVETREKLARAEEGLARIQSEPAPTHGVVPRDRRSEALRADRALQQDLQELGVNLAELKVHLLQVWQQAAGPLERLTLAADDLVEFASASLAAEPTASASAVSRRCEAASLSYRDTLAGFAKSWDDEFQALIRLEPDPLSTEVLEVANRVRRKVNDFLYASGRRITALRSEVRAIQADPSNAARHHVFQSKLTRRFQRVEAAHHRLEFAAGALETPANFRLDAAIVGARGLRRRSRERIRRIDKRLAVEATSLAVTRRTRQLAAAQQHVHELRIDADRIVNAVLPVQEGLNAHADLAAGFMSATLQAEFTAARREFLAVTLADTQGRLTELIRLRRQEDALPDVTLVSCEVIEEPSRFRKRWGGAAVAAAATIILVLFGQWWVARRL